MENTPFFCSRYQRNCIRCGSCKNESFLDKHHLQIYEYLITITDCAYFWIDKEIGDSYNKQYIAEEFSETALDRLSMALYASGYHYESMDKNTEENVLFDRIKDPAASNGVSNLQRCRAAGYLTLAAVAKCLQAATWLVARGNKAKRTAKNSVFLDLFQDKKNSTCAVECSKEHPT